jgi:DNA adenine methylase
LAEGDPKETTEGEELDLFSVSIDGPDGPEVFDVTAVPLPKDAFPELDGAPPGLYVRAAGTIPTPTATAEPVASPELASTKGLPLFNQRPPQQPKLPEPEQQPVFDHDAVIDQLHERSNIVPLLIRVFRETLHQQLADILPLKGKRKRTQVKENLKNILRHGRDEELRQRILRVLALHNPDERCRIQSRKTRIQGPQLDLQSKPKPRVILPESMGGPKGFLTEKTLRESPWRDDLLLVPKPNGAERLPLEGGTDRRALKRPRVRAREEPHKLFSRIGNKENLLPNLDTKDHPLIPRIRFEVVVETCFATGAVTARLAKTGRIGPETKLIFTELDEDTFDACEAVRLDPENLIRHLARHQQRMSKEYYDELVRKQTIEADIKHKDPLVVRAARIIAITKSAFGSMSRKGPFGHINVQYRNSKHPEKKPPTICNERNIRMMSQILQNAIMINGSYEECLQYLPEDLRNAFIYMDPPYYGQETTNEYGVRPFTEADQRKLAEIFGDLASRGAYVAASNSADPFIEEIYRPHSRFIFPVTDKNALAARYGNGNNKRDEFFITSYAP